MMSRLWKLCTLTLLALCLGGEARAQGLILPQHRPGPAPRPLSVKSQKVSLHITSGVMNVEVEQLFYNPNAAPVEGTYLFPLPEGATVSHFRMTVDNEPLEGKLL